MREELELSKIVFNLKQFQSATVQEFVFTVVNQTVINEFSFSENGRKQTLS